MLKASADTPVDRSISESSSSDRPSLSDLSFSFVSNPSSPSPSLTSRAVPFSETSSDDDSSFREKSEHLQILVRQLSRQLKSEKIRREGVETLSRHLKQEREQNVKLEETVENCQSVIQTLQNRLAQNGLPTSVETDQALGSSVSFVGQESFDSLIRENLQLKQELKYLSVDPVGMDELIKHNNELRVKVSSLQQKIISVQTENHEVTLLLGATTDDKHVEIIRLKKHIDELQNKSETKDVLCHSLSLQTNTLEDRLKETSQLCQQLLLHLEQKESGAICHHSQDQLRSSFVKLNLSTSGDRLSMNDEKQELQSQISKLQAQLEEVVSVNQKWQEYHTKREEDFATLQKSHQELADKIAKTSTTPQMTEHQQEQIDKLILQYKRQIDSIEQEKSQIDDENRELRLRCSQLTDNRDHLEKQLKGLLPKLVPKSPSASELQEKMQALEVQVKIYKEDFDHERSDRQRAHGRIADLEREIQMYKTQMEAMQRTTMNPVSRRQHNRNLVQCDNINMDDTPMPEASGPPLLIGRGLDSSDPEDDDEGLDEIDIPAANKARLQPGSNGTVAPPTNMYIYCPQCQREFSKKEHSQLLEHMDACLS